MKIDQNLQPTGNIPSDAVQNSKSSRTEESVQNGLRTDYDGTDTVQVSSKFADAQQLTAKLQQLPDVRNDRVSALREKIQQGSYKPDATDVAEALLNDPLNRLGRG